MNKAEQLLNQTWLPCLFFAEEVMRMQSSGVSRLKPENW